ncbi:hypothetical protein ACH5RR_036188 [Cinchona calisaya]|uniref:Uncharacterized protein n=1 Tax=Cinchona calisaya TaxID=153742 RepID=A0ABD2Y774_9GENT
MEESITDFSNNLTEISANEPNKSIGRDFSFTVNHPFVKFHGDGVIFCRENLRDNVVVNIAIDKVSKNVGAGQPKVVYETGSKSEDKSRNRSKAETDEELEEKTEKEVEGKTEEDVEHETK